MSTNRWVANSIARQGQTTNGISQAMVAGKVLALLNKLSTSNFDSISDQVIVWANVSENERDARTLRQVITIIYDTAVDEASRSELYARLCRKVMEQISPKVMEDGVQTSDGRHVAGAHLFRKHILNRAQEEFERGWSFAELVMTSKLFSDEYYTAQKARRRSIGYITFLGELFKLQMLTERIMHECVKALLMGGESDSESIEGLCTLLNIIGCLMDTPRARAFMDVYFSRMKEMTKQPKLSLRLRFMLLNTIELRERNWIPRANKLVQAAVISIPRTVSTLQDNYVTCGWTIAKRL
ncbi:armadillo-type protein [Irpex lacteus]|nr:armadillo-type protein [Irpex lacteus]